LCVVTRGGAPTSLTPGWYQLAPTGLQFELRENGGLRVSTLWENCGAIADETLTQEKRFAAAALAGRNCFLTGMAGNGKSTTLRAFIRESIKRVDVTAPTGVAALNVGGMTIHKSQGLKLNSAYLDIRAARAPGQAYVAVSRVRTLAGLQFKEWFKGVHVSPEAIRFYQGRGLR